MSATQVPVEQALTRSTVRLLAGTSPADLTSQGTGFFYKVLHERTNQTKILILTNKHVLDGASLVQFLVPHAASLDAVDDQKQPIGRVDQQIQVPTIGRLFPHPDPSVDLCGIDVTQELSKLLLSGRQVRAMFLDANWLPSESDKTLLRDIEQVLVVGYPHGIWDDYNNMPVARLGTTATHALALYQGGRNFLVDIAAFPGSSGSPVFCYEAPMFQTSLGSFSPGTKVQFLGIVWGVLEQPTVGALRPAPIPSALGAVPVLNTSLHLAIALHASAVLEVDRAVLDVLERSIA